jgi:hypothetical protein
LYARLNALRALALLKYCPDDRERDLDRDRRDFDADRERRERDEDRALRAIFFFLLFLFFENVLHKEQDFFS